jgi:hypothetical protein
LTYTGITTPPDLGNTAISGSYQPSSTLDISRIQIKQVPMWMSTTVDERKRAQLGRLRLRTTGDTTLDCGDTSLPLLSPDLHLAVDPEYTGGLGPMVIGAAAVSSICADCSTNASVSINGFSLLILRQPTRGVFTTDIPALPTTKPAEVQKQISSTFSNAGNIGTLAVKCPEYSVTEESYTSFENSKTVTSTWEVGTKAAVGVEVTFTTEVGIPFVGKLETEIEASASLELETRGGGSVENLESQGGGTSNSRTITFPSVVCLAAPEC